MKTEKNLKLKWLINLRWFAAAGMVLCFIAADLIFEAKIDRVPLIVTFSIIALSNGLLYSLKDKIKAGNDKLTEVALIFDTFALAYILYLTGGPFNPFSILFLVHISLAAVILGTRQTWCLAALSSFLFATLFVVHKPFELMSHEAMGHGHGSSSMSFHLYGMLVAFIVTALLTAYFLSKLTSELRKREEEVNKLQIDKLKEQRLASLATLSAGAAHELSSPLSTIAVSAKELLSELRLQKISSNDILDDALLIDKEVSRCRDIINKICTQGGQLKGELPIPVSSEEIVSKLKNEISASNLTIESHLPSHSVFLPLSGLLQSISALINNALDASNGKEVKLLIHQENSSWVFVIKDSGQGMSKDIIEKLGEPFFTTKVNGQGMGLGFYLCKLFSDSWNGDLRVKSAEGLGSKISLSIPVETATIETVQNKAAVNE